MAHNEPTTEFLRAFLDAIPEAERDSLLCRTASGLLLRKEREERMAGNTLLLIQEADRAKKALWTILDAPHLAATALIAIEEALAAYVSTWRTVERASWNDERNALKAFISELERDRSGSREKFKLDAQERKKLRDVIVKLLDTLGPGHAFLCKPMLRGRCICGRTALFAEATEAIRGA